MNDPERTAWLHRQFEVILEAAMERRADDIIDAISETGERYGGEGVFAICCALAETVRSLAFPDVKQGDGSLTGDMLIVENLTGKEGHPASLWACRFVVAYVNGDAGNTTSLFFGSMLDPDAHVAGVIELIMIAADMARQQVDSR